MIKEETEDTSLLIDTKEMEEKEMEDMKEKDLETIETTPRIDIEEEKEVIVEKIGIEEKEVEVEAEAIATEEEEIQEEDTQMKEMKEIITRKEDTHHQGQDQDLCLAIDQFLKDLIAVQVEVNKKE